ncbi:MAG: site-2 protease family protein [Acidimicrobiia bacterium]|nr:site-2 protease family protein [Acidimicrobiia bacterium]
MLRSDVRIGRIAGVPVYLNWTVVVLVWLLGSMFITRVLPDADPGLAPGARLVLGLAGAAAFVGSILAHEVGHAVMAKRGGVPVDSIRVWLFGGLAQLAGEARRPGIALRIAVAGPAVSLAVGFAAVGLEVLLDTWGVAPGLAAVASWLGRINLLLAALNLLPALPLDGGRVLEAALWWRWGDRDRAVRTAAGAGRVLGYGLVAVGAFVLLRGGGFGGLWLGLIGFFLASSARLEAEGHRARSALAGTTVGEVMSPVVPTVPSYLTVEEFLRDHVAHQPHATWTVRSWGGELEGVVSAARLAGLPTERRALVHLREVAVPIDQVPWARPDELVLDVLGRAADAAVLVVDVEQQQLRGMLSPADVHRAILQRAGAPRAPRSWSPVG